MSVYDYEEIYSFKVDGLTKEQYVMEDIPHEYKIVKSKDMNNPSGLMVWGKYENKWYPNPSCRYLIRHLLNIKKESVNPTDKP